MIRLSRLFLAIAGSVSLLTGCGKEKPLDFDIDRPSYDSNQADLQKYPASGEIKIISFNVRYGTAKETNSSNNWSNRSAACLAMIKDHKPTCIGFQEAVYDIQFLWFKDQLKDEYDGFGVGRDNGKDKGECMGILYRKSEVKLIDGGTFWLSPTPDLCSKAVEWDAACFRTATWGIFEVIATGKRFCYINTHLDHKGSKARSESMKLIAERFRQYNPDYSLPQFLSADFNAQPSDAIFQSIPNMRNSRDLAPSGKTDNNTTYNAWGNNSNSHIDNILFSSPAQVKEYHTITEPYNSVAYLSDHFPIYAIFSL
ncbi:MAG: endonuclease/exonuclease/phosphatase family protein [Bacteroidales bacterium]|nr:endonuclease/exonuclease/phosphatase family protein [Bacteroidales bacterium]